MSYKRIVVISGVFPTEPVTSTTLNYDLTKALAGDFEVVEFNPQPSRPMGFDFKNAPSIDNGSFTQIITNSFASPINVHCYADENKQRLYRMYYELYRYSLAAYTHEEIAKYAKKTGR